jgi:hypothetical protein
MYRVWTTKCGPCGYLYGVSCMSGFLTHLTSSVRFVLSTRAAAAGSSRRTTLTAVLLLSVANPYSAQAYESRDRYILYSHSRIINYTQFKCFVQLIDKENRSWNPDAIGNLAGKRQVYGIGQMKSTHYKTLDGYTQIDYSLKYIKNRYKTPCKAWSFFKDNGYH